MDTVGLQEEKRTLRKALRVRRAEAAAYLDEPDLAARDFFLQNFMFPADTCVAFYMAQRGELDPSPLAEALSARGHALCLPVVEQKGKPLLFRAYQWGDFFRLGPMRIPEPLASAPLTEPDVLLIPLVGFDRQGNRLGQGGGFYDLTLRALRQKKRIFAVGLAYSLQEEPAIPVGPEDQPLDAIITESGFIQPSRP